MSHMPVSVSVSVGRKQSSLTLRTHALSTRHPRWGGTLHTHPQHLSPKVRGHLHMALPAPPSAFPSPSAPAPVTPGPGHDTRILHPPSPLHTCPPPQQSAPIAPRPKVHGTPAPASPRHPLPPITRTRHPPPPITRTRHPLPHITRTCHPLPHITRTRHPRAQLHPCTPGPPYLYHPWAQLHPCAPGTPYLITPGHSYTPALLAHRTLSPQGTAAPLRSWHTVPISPQGLCLGYIQCPPPPPLWPSPSTISH